MASSDLPPSAGRGIPSTGSFHWQHALTLLLVAVVALYFLWLVRGVLLPFLSAFFLAALLDPLVTRMQKRGLSRGRAVANIYLLVFLVIVTFLVLVLPPAVRQIEDLVKNSSKYQAQIERQVGALYGRYQPLLTRLGVKQNPLTDKSGPVAGAAIRALNTIESTLVGLSGQILWIVIIPLSLFYFLLDFQTLRSRIISLLPESQRANVDTMSVEIVEIFSAYMRSLAIVCALYGITASVIFWVLGLRYALFLGLAAGLFYAVPYAGPALSTILAAVIALTMGHPAWYPFLVVACFLTMHATFDYGITPRLVGGSVGLHPIVNIFALMCGATLAGIWGMLLAVPVAASIQMVLVYFFPRLAQPAQAKAAGEEPELADVSVERVKETDARDRHEAVSERPVTMG